MSWFGRIVRRLKGSRDDDDLPPPTPPELWTVAGIGFDTTGWRLVGSSPGSMSWSAPGATLVLTCDAHEAEPERSLTHARNRARAQARANGEDLVMLARLVLSRGEARQVIYKRKDGTGYGYRGLIELHHRTTRFRIASDMDEMQMTGSREAIVGAAIAQCGELRLGPSNPDGSRALLGYFHDPYDSAFDEGALNAITDDERLDSITPYHPLSRIRNMHRTIAATLVLEDGVAPSSGLAPPAATDREPTEPRRQLSSRVVRALLGAAGRFDDVERSFTEELESRDGVQTPELAKCLLEYGMFIVSRGRPGNAVAWLSRAEQMLAATLGEDTVETAVARTERGYTLFKLGRNDEALPTLLRALEVLAVRQKGSSIHALALSGVYQILADRGDSRSVEYGDQLQELAAKAPKPPRPTGRKSGDVTDGVER